MVRLTAELIENAPQFTNAIQDRELDLHGYKFPAIENMGSTLDQFDTIDLSGNEIRKLDGFPLLKRLKALILNNNKIVRIAEDLGQQLPYLNTLILTSNSFTELRELDPLATCDKLTFLTLTHCPVTMRANYRLYVISLLPSLRFLDYKRVTNSERKLANSMFKRIPAMASSASGVKGAPGLRNGIRSQNPAGGTTTVKTFIPGAPLYTNAGVDKENTASIDARGSTETKDISSMPPPPPAAAVQMGNKRPGGSAQDLYAIQEAIKRARTMDEVDRLHQLLSSGQFAGFAIQWQQQLRLQQQQNQQQRQQQQEQQEQEQQRKAEQEQETSAMDEEQTEQVQQPETMVQQNELLQHEESTNLEMATQDNIVDQQIHSMEVTQPVE
ncbi:U2 small nuclear ribonucleoprotein A [Fasciola hepatica]|uniref:U2 small nuclear ribonucleoprotein A n=1 Tax=Fasciola hepatica TaxID=6192 RepID=A0A4E0RMU4_FASHE|nr:U2 small nuclear ribonucleoprotein A [Fasciola hepatica]